MDDETPLIRFVARAYVLGSCVLGDNDLLACTAAGARSVFEGMFWEAPPAELETEAPKLAALIRERQRQARAYGVEFKVRRSKARAAAQ